MFTKLVRIGRDAEMKYLQTGTAVLEVSVVYDIGFGDNKKSQWVKLAMFGQRAEKLAPHFTKGKQIVATMDDVKSEAWISNGEAKSIIRAKLVEFEFAGGTQAVMQQQAKPSQPIQQPPAQQAPRMAPQHVPQSYGTQPHRPSAPVYNDDAIQFDDDLPF